MTGEWREVTVGEIASTARRNALVGGPFGSNLVSRDYVESGVPVIRGQNMGERCVSGEFVYVTPSKAASLEANIARPGDIVFTQRGTLGQVALVPVETYERYLVSQSQMKLTVDREVADSLFIYYVFSSDEQKAYIRQNSIQTGVPHTNLGILRNTPILLPPLNEQRAIAHILGTLDDKIELNRKMNQTLEAMAGAIFKSWFVDFDPVRAKAEGRDPGLPRDLAALFPDSFEDSELGEIPKGWRVGKIRDCCLRVENGGTPKRSELQYWHNGTIPWLTSGEVRQPVVVSTGSKITQVGLEESSAKLWPVGSTVVAMYGATAGQVCFLAKEMCTNQACCGLIPKPGFQYFVYLLMSSSLTSLVSQARGSAQQNLSQGIVGDFPTILPGQSVMATFDKHLTPFFIRWISNVEESRTLATLRDGLLPKLLSGEIRVKDAVKAVETT